MIRKKDWAVLAVVTGSIVAALAQSAAVPDTVINPSTGHSEIASTDSSAGNPDVVHVEHVDEHHILTTPLSSSPDPDLDPRLTVLPNGDTWVVWWRQSAPAPIVVGRKRTIAEGNWRPEVQLNDPAEGSDFPEIVTFGPDAWSSFEGALSDGFTAIRAGIILDEPDPAGFTMVATTNHSGDVDSLLETDDTGSFLWVSWVDDAIHLGWSEFDPGTGQWSNPSFVDYTALGGVPQARDYVESVVTSP